MKSLPSLALIIGSLLLAGCESEPRIGMTEKDWLRNTVLSDSTYEEGNVKAYRSNRLYYYFRDGILVKIDPSWIASQTIADLGKATQMAPAAPVAPAKAPTDTYTELKKLDELRKTGVLTEEEFQAQKKKVLERKE